MLNRPMNGNDMYHPTPKYEGMVLSFGIIGLILLVIFILKYLF